ncbi:hypothetical protein TBLA_0H00380 [Henningerozyma blattae CBS 6284]|uniref:DASH complex subunit DAD4 n=1 Tax=Henningerozyma blattae (strain ATCC 34711 / CBS 6284 / DSM 70876 / NBRC 10599 / NRRL Y-10934 / UCD 77-7) TaxID=1071380 RepID=I2H7H9_HENB6|nr:hypothetical protein TBLA_0H00380 [Tetrapisispora blattae CBS 6284]CCH62331.1 hypothetical protein TBLA_0H00380 [Tetrapisispora blattae CBS 6284]
MNPTKERQYQHLAQQLETLQNNLKITNGELVKLNNSVNKNMIDQIGKINYAWFFGSKECFEERFSNRNDPIN